MLKYNIKEAYIDNTLNLYSSLEEFQGIKRLNIFKFHEDKNMLLPVETEFDVENGLLYAEVDELGTYCIMDMEIWLNNLGVEMPEENQSEENAVYFNSPSILSASENSGSVWTPTYINAPIDLVFMIDSDGNYKNEFENEKSLIANICNSAFACYKDVRVHIISCTCTSSDILKLSNGKSWFENINEVQKALNSIQYKNCSSKSEQNDKFNTLINGVSFQDNSDRFIYTFHNHGNFRTSYDRISSLDFCRMKLGIYSEILPVNWYYPDSQYEITLKKEITDNNGLFIEIDSNTLTTISENIANNLSYVRPVYEIIIPNKWKKIYLDGELSPTNGIDTDKDTLTDWKEVDTARLIWNEDGSFEIPTFNIAELTNHLIRFQSPDYNFLYDDMKNNKPRYYLPILSDPTNEDSDGDGIFDENDTAPFIKGLDGGIIGELSIVSCDDGFGHSYLAYKSYVNDTLDLSGFFSGFDNNNQQIQPNSNYVIRCDQYITFGNFGKFPGDTLEEGLYFNREIYNYETLYKTEGKEHYTYQPNSYITREINEKQLEALISEITVKSSKYVFASYNCVNIAIMGWFASLQPEISSSEWHKLVEGLDDEAFERVTWLNLGWKVIFMPSELKEWIEVDSRHMENFSLEGLSQ